MNSGIYSIRNRVNGDEYIGSAKDFEEREYEHFRTLKNNTHHNIYLQRAFNKYGSVNFVFEKLVYCEISDLIVNENKYFEIRKPKYNICPVANSRLGTKHRIESKRKISEQASKRDFDEISKYLPHGSKNKNPNARIKDDDAYNAMCLEIKSGGNLLEISKKYSVSYRIVLRARSGIDEVEIRNYKGKKLTDYENQQFMIDFNGGMRTKDLSVKYGLHMCSVYSKIKKFKCE